MAPGNKAKTFNGSSLSKSQPESQHSGSGTKKKKRAKKSAKGGRATKPEATRCYSPLVYDPEASLQDLMQKYAKRPETFGINELREYESDTQMIPRTVARIRVSNYISRFEIPMDVKLLEKMSANEYLRNYCRVCKRRQMYYKKFFDKFDKDKDGVLSITEMESALNDVYFNEIPPRQRKDLMALTSEENEEFDSKLFFSLCALSERLFYSSVVTENTSQTYSEMQWVETADFSGINWKLDGCNISKTLKRLFSILGYRLGSRTEEL